MHTGAARDSDVGAGTAQPTVESLLREMARLPVGSPERLRARDAAVHRAMPLARALARRFTGRGESFDDLVQVACVALIKAVDGFDPDLEHRFTSYAVPTIVGELKRHFRDRGWDVRVPRRLKELVQDVRAATGVLNQALGRAPTVAEIAGRLGVSEDDVLEALTAGEAYSSRSLDAPVYDDESGGRTLGDTLVAEDDPVSAVEDSVALQPLLQALPDRERTILVLRFYGNLSQSQIAERFAISQMSVSRILARTLRDLREQLADDGEGPRVGNGAVGNGAGGNGAGGNGAGGNGAGESRGNGASAHGRDPTQPSIWRTSRANRSARG